MPYALWRRPLRAQRKRGYHVHEVTVKLLIKVNIAARVAVLFQFPVSPWVVTGSRQLLVAFRADSVALVLISWIS